MPIEAVEHIRPLKGGAQSHLLRADDGHYYVVKFVNNPQGARILANEWIAARLARALGLPVPPCALVHVPAALVDGSPGLRLRLRGEFVPCATGLHFGSRLPTADPHAPIYDYLPEASLSLIANLRDFGGMLAFDKWTCNCNGRQVIFCRPAQRQRLHVFMVDQGFCFNADQWDYPDHALRGVYCRDVVYGHITGWDAFEPWLSRLESLPDEAVFAAADEMPPVWYGGDWGALEALLARLQRRRARVRALILELKNSPRAPFLQWRDRALGALA